MNLQAPIHQYLPWLKIANHLDYSNKITVAHLLSHTSGISREFACPFSDALGRWYPMMSVEACINSVEFHSAPGERLKYSNVGFAILGQLISAIESHSPTPSDSLPGFAEFMTREILLPLGMADAKYDLTSSEILTHQAQGYGPVLPNQSRNKVPPSVSALANTPAYFLALTEKDMGAVLRILRAIGKGTDLTSIQGRVILSAKTLNQMNASRIVDKYSTYQYGYGLTYMPDAQSGRYLIGHSGGAPGFRVYYAYDPASDIGAAAMTNVPEQTSREIVDLLLKSYTANHVGVVLSTDTTSATTNTGDLNGPFSGVYNDWAFSFTIYTTGYDADGRSKLDIFYDGKRRTLIPLPGQAVSYRIPEEGPYGNQPGEIITFAAPAKDGKSHSLIWAFGYQFNRL